MKAHPLRSALLVFLVLFVFVNAFAYRHAYAMTHFVDGGPRTESIRTLSRLQKAAVVVTGVRIPKPVNRTTPADRGLPFTTHHFDGPDGITYEAWHIPQTPAAGLCVLFHGYAGFKSSLLGEAEAFRALGYETLLVDLRGSGGSSGHVTTIGYGEADDVRAAVSYARRTWPDRPLVLYGQSMGAAAVLRALADDPLDVRAVILEAPFDRLLSTVRNRFHVMGLPAFPFAELLVFWGGVQHGYSGFDHNPADYARHVACPTLVLHGRQDPFVTVAEVQAVFDGLSSPKQLMLFPDAGHEACLRKEPARWTAAVAAFLMQLHGG
jgi:alpha-beta hydrolase superfamily lysophospholipase